MSDSKKKKIKDANALTMEEHFAELKKRVLAVVSILIVLFVLCIWKSNDILTLFLKQGRNAGYTMIALSPQDALLQQLRVSFALGAVLSLPVLLYEIVVFVTPAVDKAYKRKFWLSAVFGMILFILGVCFTIYILFPVMLNYMRGISNTSNIALEISVENYISFFLTMVILIGFIFEIPLISLFLVNIGLITSSWMKKYRKIMIVAILVIGAVITPPDVVSQVMVATPMIILYEISIWLCRMTEKKH